MTRRTKRKTPEGYRYCQNCKKVLPNSEFGWSSKARNKLRHDCKNCRNLHKWILRRVKSDREQLLQEQHYCCAICDIHNEISRLGVDHNHKTQAIRGLLCHDCNTGLAAFEDDPNYLARAMIYLEARENE